MFKTIALIKKKGLGSRSYRFLPAKKILSTHPRLRVSFPLLF